MKITQKLINEITWKFYWILFIMLLDLSRNFMKIQLKMGMLELFKTKIEEIDKNLKNNLFFRVSYHAKMLRCGKSACPIDMNFFVSNLHCIL